MNSVIPIQQADESGFPSSPPKAQKDNNASYANYLRLFQNSGRNGPQQSALSPEDSHTLKIAPLFSGLVHATMTPPLTFGKQPFSQYGVLGMVNSGGLPKSLNEAHKHLLFSNTEEPWSAFICGSQGSGKSHTLSCLLENNLLPDPEIGTLKTPLTGLVFHYDKFANFGSGQVCEAAYLCSALNGGVPVQVLVAPTSLKRMAHQYHNLPGLPEGSARPKVLPLYFSQEQLSVDTMMTLMAVNDTETTAPLYISVIRQLLREIAMDNQDARGFNYHDFRLRLARLALTEGQNGPLMLRLQLLQSFLLEEDQTPANRAAFKETWTFNPGTLTIIDLSDQFVNETDACALFSICLKLFMADWHSNPRIVALDEAHKFLTASAEATKLTGDLVSIIRQQRHMSARVIVATQEPTVSEALLDLCNVSIIHRFNSPKWYEMLQKHLAGACGVKQDTDILFREIVKLSTGEALVFCPTAVLDLDSGKPVPLQDGVVKVLVRDRISADGGQSIQASSQSHAQKNGPLPEMPQYQRFRGDKVPAPGSLAPRPGVSFKQNLSKDEPVTHSTRQLRSMSNIQTATSDQQLSNTATKRQRTTYDGAFSESDGSEMTESTSTYQGSDSGSDSPPAMVPRLANVNPVYSAESRQQNQKLAIVAVPKQDIFKRHKYRNTGVSEEELTRLMQQVVKDTLRNKIGAKNPSGYLVGWLDTVNEQCGLPPTYLRTRKLSDDCKEKTAMGLLKRVLKKYYDDRGVPHEKRPNDCPWLMR